MLLYHEYHYYHGYWILMSPNFHGGQNKYGIGSWPEPLLPIVQQWKQRKGFGYARLDAYTYVRMWSWVKSRRTIRLGAYLRSNSSTKWRKLQTVKIFWDTVFYIPLLPAAYSLSLSLPTPQPPLTWHILCQGRLVVKKWSAHLYCLQSHRQVNVFKPKSQYIVSIATVLQYWVMCSKVQLDKSARDAEINCKGHMYLCR